VLTLCFGDKLIVASVQRFYIEFVRLNKRGSFVPVIL
jgi:hypothetical protein